MLPAFNSATERSIVTTKTSTQLVYEESLFRLCPDRGCVANSVGVSPLRLECGRLVL
jgi:hypothetical protein